jgi:hypothetical protein
VVALVNQSKKSARISLDVDQQLKNLMEVGISLLPNKDINLQPREKIDIEFRFTP